MTSDPRGQQPESSRSQENHLLRDALAYAENIIATLREPFVVLDKDLRIKTANRTFYQTFDAKKEETEGRFTYDLGDGQWNIPRLRTVLDEVLSNHLPVLDFEVEHDFPAIGKKTMLLNARRFQSVDSQPDLILLAIEDRTERKRAEVAMQTSEVQYRRLFQTARDGILILDANTVKIIDANPFMTELLGYSRDELLGKELWEIGFFGDKRVSQAVNRELQEQSYVRYDHLPLETKNGQKAEVEFVSNVYQVDGRTVAQCNIRDISERSRLERKTKEQAEALADLHRRKDEFLAMLSHELSATDADFLADVIPRLPCDDPQYAAVTLDLNGKVLIRSRDAQQARPTDVELTSSRLSGEAVVRNTDRRYVERASALQHADRPEAVHCSYRRKLYRKCPRLMVALPRDVAGTSDTIR